VFGAAGEGFGEGGGVADGGGHGGAVVFFAAGEQAVFAVGFLGWVELGGVLQVLDAELAFFGAEPAFVADVGVAAALVEGGEYLLYFGGGVACGVEPGVVAAPGLDVAGGVLLGYLGESGAGGFEAGQCIADAFWLLAVGGCAAAGLA
jgi:hypothetical protein